MGRLGVLLHRKGISKGGSLVAEDFGLVLVYFVHSSQASLQHTIPKIYNTDQLLTEAFSCQ